MTVPLRGTAHDEFGHDDEVVALAVDAGFKGEDKGDNLVIMPELVVRGSA